MNTCQGLLSLMLSLWLRGAASIKCYECYTVTHPYYTDNDITKKLCKNFDYSDAYIIDCGNSTYCRKTVMSEVILHSLVETERGCARQLYVGLNQKYGLWHNEQRVVDDVYKEECNQVDGYGLRSVKVENCYCKTDLCNSATSLRYSVICLYVIVTLIIKNLIN